MFRSALFLSGYSSIVINCLLIFRALGLRYRYAGNLAPVNFILSGFIGGFLSTLIEKKSRRIEVALYGLSTAIEMVCNSIAGVHTYRPGEIVVGAVKATAFKASKSASVGVLLAFMASMAVVGHAYMRHPEEIRAIYLGMLRKVFDSDAKGSVDSPKENAENKDK